MTFAVHTPGATVKRKVSQLTPSLQSGSVAFAPVPVAVPVQLPVNGGTGPVGAIAPVGGFAALTCRTGHIANAKAALVVLASTASNNQRYRPSPVLLIVLSRCFTSLSPFLLNRPSNQIQNSTFNRSEERRVGKECRSRWS